MSNRYRYRLREKIPSHGAQNTGMQAKDLIAIGTNPVWHSVDTEAQRLLALADETCGEIELELTIPACIDLTVLPDEVSTEAALSLLALCEYFNAADTSQQMTL